MFNFFGLLRVLVTIAKELRQIRTILEIAYKPELELDKLYTEYEKSKPIGKDSDREFIVSYNPPVDEYGQELKS
jgi:hypothetical protein